jgi:hypothetical protein
MALPSGSFASAYAGSLRITASASISGSAFSINYESWGWSETNIALRPFVNTGSSVIHLPVISRLGPTSEIVLAYPGGGAVWALGMEELSYSIAGAGSVSAQNIYLIAELFKR